MALMVSLGWKNLLQMDYSGFVPLNMWTQSQKSNFVTNPCAATNWGSARDEATDEQKMKNEEIGANQETWLKAKFNTSSRNSKHENSATPYCGSVQ